MKYISIAIVIFFLACKEVSYLQTNKKVFTLIDESRKQFYKTSLNQNQDFSGLKHFNIANLRKQFAKNGIDLSLYKKIIILEGFNPSSSIYKGFVFTDHKDWFYYKNGHSEWSFSEIRLELPNIEEQTGVSLSLLHSVRLWDTTYINTKKNAIGNTMQDGFSFWANRIDNFGNKRIVYNYAFYEY
jgi:hypothetical protein